MNYQKLWMPVILGFFVTASVEAQDKPKPPARQVGGWESVPNYKPEDNLALGMPYQLSLWPSPVKKSANPISNAAKVLTDGIFSKKAPYSGGDIEMLNYVTFIKVPVQGAQVIVDLKKTQPISEILVPHFAPAYRAYLPRRELYYVSEDGKTFHQVGEFVNDFDPRELNSREEGKRFFQGQKIFTSGPLKTKGRYVLVQTMPTWDIGTDAYDGPGLRGDYLNFTEIVVCRGDFDPDSVQVDETRPHEYASGLMELPEEVLGYELEMISWNDMFEDGPLFLGPHPFAQYGDTSYHLSVGGAYSLAFGRKSGRNVKITKENNLVFELVLPREVEILFVSRMFKELSREPVTRDGKPCRKITIALEEVGQKGMKGVGMRTGPFFTLATKAKTPGPLGKAYYKYSYRIGDQEYRHREQAIDLVLDPAIEAPSPKRFIHGNWIYGPLRSLPPELIPRFVHEFKAAGFNRLLGGSPTQFKAIHDAGSKAGIPFWANTGTTLLSNAFNYYGPVTAEEQAAGHWKRLGDNAHAGSKTFCPEYLRTKEFFSKIVAVAKGKLTHSTHHFYANWEPGIIYGGQGCVCDRCKTAFVMYLGEKAPLGERGGLTPGQVEKFWPQVPEVHRPLYKRFISYQHGLCVLFYQRAIREAGAALKLDYKPNQVISVSPNVLTPGSIMARVMDPRMFLGEVDHVVLWSNYGIPPGGTKPALILGDNNGAAHLMERAKPFLADIAKETGQPQNTKMIYMTAVDGQHGTMFPRSMYCNTLHVFFHGWGGFTSYKCSGLDARMRAARARASTVIATFEDLVLDGQPQTDFTAVAAHALPQVIDYKNELCKLLLAKSWKQGNQRLIVLGNDGVDPLYVRLAFPKLKGSGKTRLLDRIHRKAHGGASGFSAKDLSKGILVRIPPKEYAFLEINPALDAQGYEVLDPRRVHAAFAKEKPKLEQRAAHLTALEKGPTP